MKRNNLIWVVTGVLLFLLCVSGVTAAPGAVFTGTPTTGIVPLEVKFTDGSTGSPTSWAWFFGDETYTQVWTEENASAGWQVRTAHSSVVMPDGTIVLMGGQVDQAHNMNDAWNSTDNGATWTLVTPNAAWGTRFGQSSVAMPDGSIVLMGGCSGIGWYNDVWNSTDGGATWNLLTASPGWLGRNLASSVVLPDGSIVLMGGSTYNNAAYNDVWMSTDNGTTWTQQTASAEWTARYGHSSVVMPDGSIVLIGGLTNNGYSPANDVWRSTDKGKTWTQVTANARWMQRGIHTSVLMPDGSIVLMGGFANLGYTTQGVNDVWRSTDRGVSWTQLPDAGWSARYFQSGVAMPDGSIVLMGGNANGPNMNDVWRFKPTGSSDKNPSHTYSSAGTYTVSLTTTNSGGSDTKIMTDYIKVREYPVTPAPVAEFISQPTSVNPPLTFKFTDQSSNNPSSWAWYFGDETYTEAWTEENASAWSPARTAHSSVVMPDGSIVLMGGQVGQGANLNDIWRSKDNGASWTQITSDSGWSPRYGQTSVALPDGSIVLMGGNDNNFKNDVWRSINEGAMLTRWALVTASPGWEERVLASSVVLPDGSIVLMGGSTYNNAAYNDVWISTDNGASWTQQTASAEWTARYGHSSVVMPDGSIVLIGGLTNNGLSPVNDVWRSTDKGKTWTLQTGYGGWTKRGTHTSVVMPDGSIVLMGGFAGGWQYLNDVWRSTDMGVSWTQLPNAEWSPRYYQSGVAMPDGSIVVMGGFPGYSINDVWRIAPMGSSEQNPSHTYISAGTYNVSLTVKNAGGSNTKIITNDIIVNPVNTAPVAADQSATTAEDTQKVITLTATDADGDTLSYLVVAVPSHGTLGSVIAGVVTYTPAANYNGPDSFTFKANDGKIDSNIATVSITVTPMNDAPIAVADSYSTNQYTPLVIAAPGVLVNDIDVDGNTLTAIKVTNPSHGAVTLNSNGGLTYTPTAKYVGTDSFTYKANDGSLDSAPATVSITISKPVPIAPTAAFTATPTDLTVQFTDDSKGTAPLSYSWNFGDKKTSTAQNPTHTYSNAGSYTVTLTVKNAAGSSSPATQMITVTAPPKPIAAFHSDVTTGSAPLPVQFYDDSTGTAPLTYSWNFGDKKTSTLKSPAHTYTKAGSYIVTLTVKNSAGSSIPTTKTIIVS